MASSKCLGRCTHRRRFRVGPAGLALACASLLVTAACDRCESIDPSALFADSDVVFRGSVERIYHPDDGRGVIVTFPIHADLNPRMMTMDEERRLRIVELRPIK